MKFQVRWLTGLSIVFFLIGFVLVASYSFSQAQTTSGDTLGYTLLPLKAGDKCLVCGISLDTSNGIAILYKGRRVTLAKTQIKEFLQFPEKYFVKLQPAGALFAENSLVFDSINWRWLGVGIWIFFALISSALCCIIALKKGLPHVRWFFLGLTGNLVSVFLVLIAPAKAKVNLPPGLKKMPITANPVECPSCGATNHPAARQCLGCGSKLMPLTKSEAEQVNLVP